MILNIAYALRYEEVLAMWAARAQPDETGWTPSPQDLLDDELSG